MPESTTRLGKKLLLVEDNRLSAFATEVHLNYFGFEVIHVTTGEEAVDRISTGERFDGVLMDVDLGKGIDGIKATEKILSVSKVPVVFISNVDAPATIDRIRQITGFPTLRKPVDGFDLIAILQSALSETDQ